MVRNSENTSLGASELKVDPGNGSFDILLLPGPHTLTASAEAGTGHATIQVADADIENLIIVTMPVFNVSGRIGIDGSPDAKPDLGMLRATLRRDPPVPRTSSYSFPPPDGSLSIQGGVGNFRVNIAPILNIAPTALPLTLPAALGVREIDPSWKRGCFELRPPT